MASSSLSLFWNLASSDLDERINSSSLLIGNLLSQQQEQEQQEESSQPSTSQVLLPTTTTTTANSTETSSAEHLSESRIPKDLSYVTDEELELAEKVLDEGLASEVAYSVRRLIKGLASPRENSRLGFAVALTELLSHLPTISARCILVLIIKHTTPTGAIKGQEDRDLMFGRLFGIQSLVASSLLFHSTRSTFMDLQRAIEGLIHIRNRKTWLGESCAWVMVEVLQKLGSEGTSLSNLSWKDEALNWVAGRCLLGRELNPEKLAIVLKLSQVSPQIDLERYIVPPLKSTKPLTRQNLVTLAKILKDATSPNSEDEVGLTKGSSGSWKPQLHFAWNIILDLYFPSQGVEAASESVKDRAPFHELFRVVVDDALFSPLSSSERKSWGFQVFDRAISRMPADEMPLLFTPNFMRSWINHLAGQDRALHAAALKTAKVVQEAVASNPKVGFALVSQLLGRYGSQHFDKITKTKTVENILASLDVSGVKEYISYLRDVAYGAGTGTGPQDQTGEAQQPDSAKKWAFDQLLTLVRNTSIPKNDECVLEILELFAVNGFVSTKKLNKSGGSASITTQPQTPFSDEIRAACRTRFLSCLSELHEHSSTLTDSEGKTRKAQGLTSSGESWLSKGFELISTLEKDTKHYSATVEFDAESSEARKKALATLASTRKEIKASTTGSVKSEQAMAFETVVLAALLVSYEKEGANQVLEPLADCAAKLFAPVEPASKKPSKRKAKAAAVDGDEEEAPEPTGMELLVDCLLGFLEVPSAFLRGVANQAFASFCSEMTEESLGHLIDQLGTDENTEAQENDEDAMDVDEEEQVVEGDEAASDGDETSSTSATSDASDEEDLQPDVAIDSQLRKKVAEALRASGMADSDSEDEDEVMQEAEKDAAPGTSKTLKEGADEDAGSDSGSDVSNVDDDQMLKLDDQLAQIFKLQSNKKGGDDAKLNSLTFQNKVLDLVEVFARKASASSSPLLLHLIRPLFTLAATPPSETSKSKGEASEKQVANRACGILRGKVCAGKGKAPSIDLKDEQILEIVMEDLDEMHAVARNPSSAEIASLTSSVNSFLTRVVLQSTGMEAEAASKVPKALLALYSETLKDYINRKASGVKPAFMLDALKRFPALGWALREEILAGCGSAEDDSVDEAGKEKKGKSSMNAYRQVQMMGMLQTVLTGAVQSFNSQAAPLLSFLPSVCSLILSHLNASLTSSSSLGTPRLKEALKFGLQAVRITRRVSSSDSEIAKIWKLEGLRKVEKEIRESAKFGKNNSLAGLLKQMVSIVEGSNNAKKDGGKKEKKEKLEKKDKKEKKRPAEENGEEEVKEANSLKKKVKKSKKEVA